MGASQRSTGTVGGIATLLLLALWAGGCGSLRVTEPQQPGVPVVPPPALLSELPRPSELIPREARLIDGPRFKTGDAYDAELPSHNVLIGGGVAHLTPDYAAGDPLSRTAYCGYHFDLTGWAGELSIAYSWDDAPASGMAFIGAANFDRDCWEWYPAPELGLVALPAVAPYDTPPGSNMYVLVVGLGTAPIDLATIRLGNEPPTAAFSLDHSGGPPGLVVHCDASLSSDDSAIARYRWDPEGDGTFEFNPLLSGGSPNLTHTYSQPGTYHPTLRVTDDSGVTAEASHTVTITMGNFYQGTIDNAAAAANQCAAVRANGKAAVAYRNDDKLCFQYALDVEALNWSGAIQVDVLSGACLDLALIDGNPAIAYQSYLKDVAYVRATNAAGTNWPAPVIAAVKSGQNIGYYIALAEMVDRPGIAYVAHDFIATAGAVWYTHANDWGGSSWTAPKQLNTGGAGARELALGYIGGWPRAAAEVTPNPSERHPYSLRAVDPYGDSWAVGLDTGAALTAWLSRDSLLNLNGKPGIGYWDATGSALQLTRAKLADGLEWNAAVSVAAADDTGGRFAFATINGLPCCAFADASGGLRYVIAQNSSGTAWNPPLTVDAAALSIESLALIEVAGLPAFAWCDNADGDLKFAIYR